LTNGEHIREEELELLAAGALTDDEAAALQAHASGCEECALKLAQSRGDVALLTFATKQERPAGTVKAEFMARIRASREREEHFAWPLRRRTSNASEAAEYVTGDKTVNWLNWVLVPAAVALAVVSLALSWQNRRVSQALEKQRHATQALLNEREETNKLVGLLAAGDTITVNVLGRNVTARIANMRAVDWESLGINFVLVFSPGAFAGAPPEYTRFSVPELERGFFALAFGSDLRIGARPRGIRRFNHPIRVTVIAGGSVDRNAAMLRVIDDYIRQAPSLHLSRAVAGAAAADVEVRLIDERDFKSALEAAFGAKIAAAFIARTDPQCMTSVKSTADGEIVRSVSFIIADKGEAVFLDCAYHELLHAFGLSNHDPRNPWTTLNQKRMVGYLSAYDRALLAMLYDPRVTPGMTEARARAVLPSVIRELGLAAPARSTR